MRNLVNSPQVGDLVEVRLDSSTKINNLMKGTVSAHLPSGKYKIDLGVFYVEVGKEQIDVVTSNRNELFRDLRYILKDGLNTVLNNSVIFYSIVLSLLVGLTILSIVMGG